ncbi:MAG: hypothetical protein GXP46_05770, partial [Deferribacteres bacterium]|nr:hypothetical protein [Deferribacteres bacterium]
MYNVLILLSVLLVGCLPSFNIDDHARDRRQSPAPVLESAEEFFVSLESGRYDTAWELLSEKSREAIIEDVYQASLKIRKDIRKDVIIRDFSSRGVIFNSYWRAFVNNLDTSIILERSRWEIGYLKSAEAEILISYKGAPPARLKMFKENRKWKVGLDETFRTKKPWFELLY